MKFENVLKSAATVLIASALHAQNPATWEIGPFTRPASGNPVITRFHCQYLPILSSRLPFIGRTFTPSIQLQSSAKAKSTFSIALRTTLEPCRLASTPLG
jgi:hypothetical protein